MLFFPFYALTASYAQRLLSYFIHTEAILKLYWSQGGSGETGGVRRETGILLRGVSCHLIESEIKNQEPRVRNQDGRRDPLVALSIAVGSG
ncbi:hypothetical protein IA57_05600 [Mangrovimonas yunxiaonensis]|uniref:Uncharacterized protein n=1 Tax=Mangrovimonas yunxiaonensis TaxID=1197477 RepID=A0A084TKR8_9FLAO|nr:hypothetical protein IA57_05600 [Mangrovimonas yunxiaonensis]